MALSYSERIAQLKAKEAAALKENETPAARGQLLEFEVESASKIRLQGVKLMPHVPARISLYESEVEAFKAAHVEDVTRLETAYESYVGEVKEEAQALVKIGKPETEAYEMVDKSIPFSEPAAFRRIFKRDPKPLYTFRQVTAPAVAEPVAAPEPAATKKK